MIRLFDNIALRLAFAMNGLVRESVRREEGQTLVEYALIIVTISIGVTAAMVFLRDKISGVFSSIGNAL
jgi:Flp pilus assembly pilin Flp